MCFGTEVVGHFILWGCVIGTTACATTFLYSLKYIPAVDIAIYSTNRGWRFDTLFYTTFLYSLKFLKCILNVMWDDKKIRRKNLVYMSSFCMLTKSSHEKSICFVLCVKKQNSVLCFFTKLFGSFTHARNNIGLSRSLTCAHIMSRDMRQSFIQKFLAFKSYFWWQNHIVLQYTFSVNHFTFTCPIF